MFWKLALFEVLVRAGHLDVEALPGSVLLAGEGHLVVPVEGLAGHSLA